jgi:hypothetical protein
MAKGKVLLMMNCSLAPSPDAIIAYFQAQQMAIRNDIDVTLSFTQQTINGFLAENLAANIVLKDKSYTHLMLGSDDTKPSEDIIVRLFNADKDIVSGVYRIKNIRENILAIYGVESEPFDKWLKDSSLEERPFCSGHSMFIKREVLESITEAHPELEFESATGGTEFAIFLPYIDPKIKKLYLDDWAICKRAKDLGFKCWIDFGSKMAHRCDVWLEI